MEYLCECAFDATALLSVSLLLTPSLLRYKELDTERSHISLARAVLYAFYELLHNCSNLFQAVQKSDRT